VPIYGLNTINIQQPKPIRSVCIPRVIDTVCALEDQFILIAHGPPYQQGHDQIPVGFWKTSNHQTTIQALRFQNG